MEKIKFVELFAGIGGFHLALNKISNSELIFACDIDQYCREVYLNNFNNKILGDIKEIDENTIPDFDLLCAGFPCQPFSKGGFQKGFNDTRGALFFEIVRILQAKKPIFLLLENVSNLVSHDNGNTYRVITEELTRLGYIFPSKPLVLTPTDIGIPMHRKRIYIPGIRKDLSNSNGIEMFNSIMKEVKETKVSQDIWSFLSSKDLNNKYYLNDYEINLLNLWNEFYNNIDIKIIGFPIWADIFINNRNYESNKEYFPDWKWRIISKNLDLYKRNKNFIDKWLKENDNLNWVTNIAHKKFEWQAGESINSIWNGMIQFRPSGIRVKKADILSTLVAMNHAQIIGKYKRYITPEEVKLIQGFPKEFKLAKNDNISMKQLGNTITINIAEVVLKGLLSFYEKSVSGAS